jgi:hypothetical protein
MADFPADLLERPAVDAASLVALRYLDDSTTAATRLSDRTDAEALHDFRVAVRRLRVTLQAYPGLREGVPKKYRRRLRKLTRATNAVRAERRSHGSGPIRPIHRRSARTQHARSRCACDAGARRLRI